MQVKNLFDIPELKGIKLLSGTKGLKRNIESVTIFDAPDQASWIKKGDLVLTTGYIWYQNPNIEEINKFLKKISENEAAGLGIKLGRFIEEIPEEILTFTEALNFPLFSFPMHLRFVNIISPVLTRLVNSQAETLNKSIAIHSYLSNLAIETNDTTEILTALEKILQCPIAFFDRHFDKIFLSSFRKDSFPHLINRMSNSETNLEKIISGYPREPLYIGGKHVGDILFSSSKESNLSEVLVKNTLNHASTLLKFDIQKRISIQQNEQKYRDEFLLDLIFSETIELEGIKLRGQCFGWDLDKGVVVVAINFKPSIHPYSNINEDILRGLRNACFSKIKSIMKEVWEASYYTIVNQTILFVISLHKEDYSHFKQTLKKRQHEIDSIAQRQHCYLNVGIGGYKQSSNLTHASYKEAFQALLYSEKKEHSDTAPFTFWDEMGAYQVLIKLSATADGERFWRSMLEKIIKNDNTYRSHYFETLSNLQKNNWDMKETAHKMHVHPNTIAYRIARIEELFDININASDQRLLLDLALKLKDLSSK